MQHVLYLHAGPTEMQTLAHTHMRWDVSEVGWDVLWGHITKFSFGQADVGGVFM